MTNPLEIVTQTITRWGDIVNQTKEVGGRAGHTGAHGGRVHRERDADATPFVPPWPGQGRTSRSFSAPVHTGGDRTGSRSGDDRGRTVRAPRRHTDPTAPADGSHHRAP
jgi:hypothetical protein